MRGTPIPINPEISTTNVYYQCSCASAADTFNCLVAIDAATLGAVGAAIIDASFFGTYAFSPVVDGTFIVERPTQTLAKGKHNGVRRHAFLISHR